MKWHRSTPCHIHINYASCGSVIFLSETKFKSNYMNELAIKDNSFLRQFEARVDGHLAKIEYSSQERKVFLTKLVIPEDINQKGFREDFIRAVLNHLQEENLRVVPTSPQIAGFLRKNRQYKEMLPVGIRI